MSVSYLDTIVAIRDGQGIAYSSLTKAMRVHVRSLRNDDVIASFVGDDGTVTSLDDPEGVVWFTASGEAYVEALEAGGLIGPVQEVPAAPKPKRSRRKSKTVRKTTRKVPSPSESVESPVLPKGTKARRLSGNQHGDTLHTDKAEPQVHTVNGISQSVLEDMISDAIAKALSA